MGRIAQMVGALDRTRHWLQSPVLKKKGKKKKRRKKEEKEWMLGLSPLYQQNMDFERILLKITYYKVL
jgi:transposase